MINLYNKGVRKERKIVNEARARGLISFRSAGSHSPIDLCIIDKDKKKITFVQCKGPSEFRDRPQNIMNLMEKYKWLNDEFLVDFKVL